MDLSKARFSKEHEWIFPEGSGDTVLIGITDYAASELGDIVFIELPEVGAEVTATEPMGSIEAVKTVADLFAPVTGTVTEINANLESQPELANQSPYGDGWFVKVKMAGAGELDALMNQADYNKLIGKD